MILFIDTSPHFGATNINVALASDLITVVSETGGFFFSMNDDDR